MVRRAVSTIQVKACAALILLACCPCASALNPSLDINQYAHTAWTARDGFFKGIIYSIAQTPDGYLWLGTEFGLLRFDGVRSVPWQPPAGEHLPSTFIRSLLAARDGRLWIGTSKGLASWKDRKLTHYPELAGRYVDSLLEDREGTIWTGASAIPNGELCTIQSGGTQCYEEGGRFGQAVGALYEDSGGNLWAGATTGLWRWKPGPPKRFPMPEPASGINALIEGDNGAPLIATNREIRHLVDGKAEAYPLPGRKGQFSPNRLLRDRNGGLWIGTADRGLLHVHQGRTDAFVQSEGLSSDSVGRLFEDREGNIWVATSDGLDRFRDFAVPTISLKQGLSYAVVGSVLAARDGSVWLGTRDGLDRWNDGQITIYRKRSGLPDDYVESLFQDDRGRIWVSTLRGFAYLENGRFVPVSGVPGQYAHSIAGDNAGNLWISHDQSLFHLLEGSVIERIPWARLGRNDFAYALLEDSVQGGLWLGFLQSGVGYFKDGQVRASYTSADGLGDGFVNGLRLDQDGTLWAATQGGLSRVKNGRVATLTSKNGLPCDTVHGVMEDDAHTLWLYMACGLVRITRTELDAWANDPNRMIQAMVLDSSDGVRSHAIPVSNFSPRVAKSTDGKLWFAQFDGVSVIDPRHLPFNKLPPRVHIEQITADRKTYDGPSNLRLPPLIRDLEIDYTALSLVAPEKIRFRVKLEGRDPDWKDVGNERKAFYNDLPPRNYRFRVAASNNSGVWNEAGASFDFSIDPAYYQTTWFRASCVAVFLVLLWALYRLRLHQIAQQFNTRLDERTRIARELHDTLLQSFHGLMFRFQAVRNMLPRRPEEAMEALDGALERTEQAITEGRDAIQGLRSSTVVTNELAQAVTALGNEMSREMASQDSAHYSAQNSARFHVVVEGPPQDLHPILRDEVYAIAREAVRNAFRHALAHNIEVDITYSKSLLRLRIRDDGKGIDSGFVAEGRTGHYGVQGMRERAKRIGGKLDVWTGTGAGTEIELSIPGSIAYGTSPGRTVRGLFRKKAANS
jgi:ligand-binding sensor domain-containing protein/two-component sensor histidine kinase